MCIVAVAHFASRRFPLIVAANRDERYARPSAAAGWWDDDGRILGGRDLVAGGSWLGMSLSGRFAAVTNIHEGAPPGAERSRGRLVSQFLRADVTPAHFASGVKPDEFRYGPFNLIVRSGEQMHLVSNRRRHAVLVPGIHVFTSAGPGAGSARAGRLERAVEAAAAREDVSRFLLEALAGPEARQPGEQALESVFVVGEEFGTRSATVLTIDANGRAEFVEQRFEPRGVPAGCSRFSFEIDG